MTAVLTLPRLGETMEAGRLVAWLVAEGATFARGDALAEVETDKTVVELPALGPGVMGRHLVAEGAQVALGEPLAELEIDGPDWTRDADEGAPEDDTLDLPMPRLGETMEEGTLVAWLVDEGATFNRGDALLEVETDKTVAEFPALAGGRMVEYLAQPGAVVPVGAPIARIAVAPGERAAFLEQNAAEAPEPANVEPQARPTGPKQAPARSGDGPLRATPVARRAAGKAGLDLATLTGTGRRGRIELRDVEAALGEGQAAEAVLAHDDTSPGRRPAIVLVHGFAADRSVWAGLARRLSRAGHRVVSVDLPGHGETVLEAERAEDMAGPLGDQLKALGPGPHHLVAHSMGAIPAVLAAAAGRVASVALISPAGLGGRIDEGFVAGLAAPGSVEDTGALLGRMTHGDLPLSQVAIAAIHETLSGGRLKALAATLADPGGDMRAALAELANTVPVRILLGQEDRIIDPTPALGVSPLIGLHLFPATGHMPQWEAPDAVFRLIDRVGNG